MAAPEVTPEAAEAAARAGAALATGKLSEAWGKFRSERLGSMQSWSQFADRSKLRAPTPTEIPARLRSNLAHWQGNYFAVFIALIVFCILTNSKMLLAVAAIVSLWMYFFKWNTEDMTAKVLQFDIVLGSRSKMAVCCVGTFLILWLASDWNTLVWLATVEGIIVGVHSLARIPHDDATYDFAEGFDGNSELPV